jgi:hypothetical protein
MRTQRGQLMRISIQTSEFVKVENLLFKILLLYFLISLN